MREVKETRGRGIDFAQRFRASRWAEDRLFKAFNTDDYIAVRLGASVVAEKILRDEDAIRFKEPDLLVLRKSQVSRSDRLYLAGRKHDLTKVPIKELKRERTWRFLWAAAAFAIEVEFSPYKASIMKGRNWKPRTPGSPRKAPKAANPPVAPNVWVKLEDLPRLQRWQKKFGLPVVVIHMFDEEAFAVPLSRLTKAERILAKLHGRDGIKWQLETGIFKKEQNYNRGDQEAASERKIVYVVSPVASMKVGDVVGVNVAAQLGISSTGKYVTQVIFKGGRIKILPEFLHFLESL